MPALTEIHADQQERVSEMIEAAIAHGRWAIEAADATEVIDTEALKEISTRAMWWKSTCSAFESWSDEAEATFSNLIASLVARHKALVETQHGTSALSDGQREIIYNRTFRLTIWQVAQADAEYEQLAELALALHAAA